ncbi:MAG TPA: glycosyltransferase N-terminal domain-containing protein [Myxococcaceae bacterium]|nr:glycosyltransferase N-terminal domain-containing protein [Myxococcaceae bacterium]
MRWVYVLASYALFGLLFPVLALHRKTRRGQRERLGLLSRSALPGPGRPRIWLHGASAGDLLALAPMIPLLRARYPEGRIILSTMTDSGQMMARGRLAGQVDAIVHVPWDLRGATRRTVRALKPDLLVLEYTEMWPNLIAAARSAGARIALTNGRFSPQHLSRYRLLFTLIGNPLRQVDLLLMREPQEAERARQLGASEAQVRVTGNTKFDALAPGRGEDAVDPALLQGLGIPEGAPLWVAGSTHEGEEEQLLEVFSRLRRDFPTLHLLIAPRYVDRAPKLLTLAAERGFKAALRSKGNSTGAPVIILDTIGELARVYRLARVVFVGGSFTTRGGQNILEPAGQGRAVLFGPHMENFHDSVQALVGRGGIQVKDAAHLERTLRELLSRPRDAEALGLLAREAVAQLTGASERNVALLAELLEQRSEPTSPGEAGAG